MKLIPLTRGYFTQVDDEDFEELSKYKWQVGIVKKTGYKRAQRLCAITGKTVLMHRQLMKPAHRHILVDHGDRDPLNNQKHNLRLATSSQNGYNQGLGKGNTSGYKGVSWHKINKVFTSKIRVDGRQITIGYFDDAQDAARAYNESARKYYGEFACYNDVTPIFPESDRSRPKPNTSGYKGVSLLPNGRWTAEVKHLEKRIRIRGIPTKEEANEIYLRIKREIRGDLMQPSSKLHKWKPADGGRGCCGKCGAIREYIKGYHEFIIDGVRHCGPAPKCDNRNLSQVRLSD